MKKTAVTFVVFFFLLFLVTGCSSETDGSSLHSDPGIVNGTTHDELTEKTILTIASLSPHLLSPSVDEFNRTNTSYKIDVIDIQEGYGAWPDGIDNLILEIMAGNGPDMIHTYQLYQFRKWAEQGLFEDLYDMIDADPLLSRSDFVESILHGFETDGKLYQMTPGFSVRTLIGHPDIIGSDPGWGIDEFINTINENQQATIPLGPGYNGFKTLYMILTNNINSFIDWETGTASFDSEYFTELLKFAYSLESRVMQSNVSVSENAPKRRISSGEQIMDIVSFSRLEEYTAFQDLFGGDFIFKGFPSEKGSGNTIETDYGLAITTVSKNKDGAGEFLRMFLSEEWQRHILNDINYLVQFIPTNRTVLEEKLGEAMVEYNYPNVFLGDLVTTARPLTQEDVENIKTLINSVSNVPSQLDDPLMYIYMEVMIEYLNDRITAQDVARIMQNRVSTYLSEQR